jgi:hypothetical protein
LREVLDGVSRRFGVGLAADTGVLWSAWSELVGDTMAAHVEPTSLRGGVLRVRADSPAWATETSYLAEELRERANGLLGSAKIIEVKVWTGPGRVTPRGHRPARDRVQTGSQREPAPDPETAFDRARRAWWRRVREAPRATARDEESPR